MPSCRTRKPLRIARREDPAEPATLATKGVQLLTSRSYPVELFDIEPEACARLLAQRDALRARRRPLT
ncbi:hypothetical protein [Sorangium sp. So ce233]|uniref:hypothetical protein n=1 Tax=Sorangium sp. So ce233 TaxID=3133290 RepID=UPI003F5F0535